MLGLEGQLLEEVNSLKPISLVDTLIRAKAKLLSFQVGDHKRPMYLQDLLDFKRSVPLLS